VLAVKNREPLAMEAWRERFTMNFDSYAQYAVFQMRLEEIQAIYLLIVYL